jgi:hypothetical protein
MTSIRESINHLEAVARHRIKSALTACGCTTDVRFFSCCPYGQIHLWHTHETYNLQSRGSMQLNLTLCPPTQAILELSGQDMFVHIRTQTSCITNSMGLNQVSHTSINRFQTLTYHWRFLLMCHHLRIERECKITTGGCIFRWCLSSGFWSVRSWPHIILLCGFFTWSQWSAESHSVRTPILFVSLRNSSEQCCRR